MPFLKIQKRHFFNLKKTNTMTLTATKPQVPLLPENARVWLYCAEQKLSETQAEFVSAKFNEFINGWDAHGDKLTANFVILQNSILMVYVDEALTSATGCSIDKHVRLLQEIEKEIGVTFLNRMTIPIWKNDSITIYTANTISEAIKNNQVTKTDLTFNNTLTKGSVINTSWIVPVAETWVNRYF